VLLVLSWEWFWETTGSIFQTWRNGVGAAAAILGPLFIYHAWKRKPLEVRCETCSREVPLYEIGKGDPLHHFVIDCEYCGPRYYVPPQEEP
jgi:hypothetical protein